MNKVTVLTGSEATVFADDCAALHSAAFSAFGARGWSSSEITDLLSRDTNLLVFAGDGFLIGQITGQEAEILTFAVHPEKQGQGLGKKILSEFIEHCTCRKVNECVLEVAVDNAAAIALYDLYLFKRTGLRKKYFKRNSGSVSAFVMVKALSVT